MFVWPPFSLIFTENVEFHFSPYFMQMNTNMSQIHPSAPSLHSLSPSLNLNFTGTHTAHTEAHWHVHRGTFTQSQARRLQLGSFFFRGHVSHKLTGQLLYFSNVLGMFCSVLQALGKTNKHQQHIVSDLHTKSDTHSVDLESKQMSLQH